MVGWLTHIIQRGVETVLSFISIPLTGTHTAMTCDPCHASVDPLGISPNIQEPSSAAWLRRASQMKYGVKVLQRAKKNLEAAEDQETDCCS